MRGSPSAPSSLCCQDPSTFVLSTRNNNNVSMLRLGTQVKTPYSLTAQARPPPSSVRHRCRSTAAPYCLGCGRESVELDMPLTLHMASLTSATIIKSPVPPPPPITSKCKSFIAFRLPAVPATSSFPKTRWGRGVEGQWKEVRYLSYGGSFQLGSGLPCSASVCPPHSRSHFYSHHFVAVVQTE